MQSFKNSEIRVSNFLITIFIRLLVFFFQYLVTKYNINICLKKHF